MIVKLLIERHFEVLSLKGGCTGSSESTFVKMSNCWKSQALAILTKTCLKLYVLPDSCACADQENYVRGVQDTNGVQLLLWGGPCQYF